MGGKGKEIQKEKQTIVSMHQLPKKKANFLGCKAALRKLEKKTHKNAVTPQNEHGGKTFTCFL